jgi:hypothetical protein
MRHAVTILLLVIHVFNMGAYRFVFSHMEERSSVRLIQKLDRDEYSNSQLVEMRVPLQLPYLTNSNEFERYNGEIEIQGVHYNYVKRKIWNDTLIVLCIPNTGKMQLNSAKDQFFSLVNDLDQQGSKETPMSKSGIVKSITSDYSCQELLAELNDPADIAVTHRPKHQHLYATGVMDDDIKPPRI